MKENRETAQEKIMNEITLQMKQHLERLCEQEELEDFLKAYRVEPEEEEGERRRTVSALCVPALGGGDL